MRFLLYSILLVFSFFLWSAPPVYAAPYPDLIVASGSLKAGQLKFKIRNLQPADVRPSRDNRLKIRLQWLDDGGRAVGTTKDLDITDYAQRDLGNSNYPSRSYIVSSFYGEGSTWTPHIRNWLHDADASPYLGKTLRITVDPENVVTEENDDNNSLDLPRPMVDLYPTAPAFRDDHLIFKIRASPHREFFALNGVAVRFMWLDADNDPIPNAFYDWQTTSILEYLNDGYEVTLINTGDFLFDTTKEFWEYTTRLGSTYSVADYQRQFEMAPVRQFVTTNVPDNARTLRITVDQNQRVSELNEKNNVVDVERPMADLRVLNGRFYETREGFVKKVLEFKPINVGTNPVSYRNNTLMTVGLTWMAGETPIGTPYIFNALPAQYIARNTNDIVGYWRFDSQNFPLVETWLNEPPANATGLKMRLDENNVVVEKREDNNIALFTIPGVQPTRISTPIPTQALTNPSVTPSATPTPTPKLELKYIPLLQGKKMVKGASIQMSFQNFFFEEIKSWIKSLFTPQLPVQTGVPSQVAIPSATPTPTLIPTPTPRPPSDIITDAFRNERFDGVGALLADPVSYMIYGTECCGPLSQTDVLMYVQQYATDPVNARTFIFDQTNPTITRIGRALGGENQFIILASDNSCMVFRLNDAGRITSVAKYPNYHAITDP